MKQQRKILSIFFLLGFCTSIVQGQQAIPAKVEMPAAVEDPSVIPLVRSLTVPFQVQMGLLSREYSNPMKSQL
jgi:hypothetical protein